MTSEEMKLRAKQHALPIIHAAQALPRDAVGRVLGSQLLRAGTSVGADYRAACRAKSSSDFVYKLKLVEEECDESLFWMELLVESQTLPLQKLEKLMKEGDQILSIVVASLKRSRENLSRKS